MFFSSGNETVFYPINQDVQLSIGTNTIVVPIDFFKLIKEKYLSGPLNNNECCLKYKSSEYIYILCNEEFNEKSLNYLTAIMGNWSFRITPQDLFFKFKNDKVFLLMAKANKSNWIFGYSFFKNYITIVDQDSKEISSLSLSFPTNCINDIESAI